MATYGYTDPFSLELGLCMRLFELAEQGQRPLPITRDADRILFQIGARATKTYRAALHLCVLGHGEQAIMLNRSLFEDVITAHWVDANPEEAVRRLRDQQQHTMILWRDHMIAKGLDVGSLADLPDLTDDERERFESDFGGRGDRPWTGLSNFKLVKSIETRWGDANERVLLWHMHDVHLRYANASLHVTSMSVVTPVPAEANPDTLIYSSAPSVQGIQIALLGAFWAYANLLRLILPDDARDALLDLYSKGMPRFFRKHETALP